jgi:hypothetical protein
VTRIAFLVLVGLAVLSSETTAAPPDRPLREILLDLEDASIGLARQIAEQQARQQWQIDRGPLYKSSPPVQNRGPESHHR